MNQIAHSTIGDVHRSPLTPKWAFRISILTAIGGLLIACGIVVFGHIPTAVAFLGYLLALYLTVGYSWSSVERRTRRLARMGQSSALAFIGCAIILSMIYQKLTGEIPNWLIYTTVSVAVAGYSVMGVYGFRNFVRWRRGVYRPHTNEETAEAVGKT